MENAKPRQEIKKEVKMKRYNRKHKVTRHHILPKSRNGNDNPDNIWMLPREKHDSWHSLFQNRTIREAIAYLKMIADEIESGRYAKHRVDFL